jgi:RNA polymerase sigma-70 factor (ECF subfamily)
MPDSIDNERFRNLLFSWPGKAMVFLHHNYYDRLVRFSQKHTHDREASKDIVQDIFEYVLTKHKFLGTHLTGSIQHYLWKAVENKSISAYRRKSRTVPIETHHLDGYPEVADASESSIISEEKKTYIPMIVSKLTPREKECLLLQIDRGLTVKEISAKLAITVKAVERNLTSARKRLRKYQAWIF